MFVMVFLLCLAPQVLALSAVDKMGEDKTLIYLRDHDYGIYYLCQFGTVEDIQKLDGSYEQQCYQQNKEMQQIIDGVTYYPFLKFGSERGHILSCTKDIPNGSLGNCEQGQELYSSCDYTCKEGYDKSTNGSLTCDLVGPMNNVSAEWSVKDPCTQNPKHEEPGDPENNLKIIIPVVMVGVLVFIVLAVLFVVWKCRRRQKEKITDVPLTDPKKDAEAPPTIPDSSEGAGNPGAAGSEAYSPGSNSFFQGAGNAGQAGGGTYDGPESDSEETVPKQIVPSEDPDDTTGSTADDVMSSTNTSNISDNGYGKVEPGSYSDSDADDGGAGLSLPALHLHEVESLKQPPQRNGSLRNSPPRSSLSDIDSMKSDSTLNTSISPDSSATNNQAISELFLQRGHYPSLNSGRMDHDQRGNIYMNKDKEIKGSLGSKMNGVLKEIEKPLQTGSSAGMPNSPKLASNEECKQESLFILENPRTPQKVNAAPLGAAGGQASIATNDPQVFFFPGPGMECTQSVNLFLKQSMSFVRRLTVALETIPSREKYQALEGYMRENWREFGFASQDEVEVIVSKHREPGKYVSEYFLKTLTGRDVKIGRLVEYFCNISHFNGPAVDIMLEVHKCQYCEHIRKSVPKL